MDKILLICLLIPVLAGFFSSDLNLENRAQTEFPAFPDSLSGLDDFFAGVDDFVSDNIGLRNQMILAKKSLDKKVNRQGNAKVIVGREGWMYYNAPSVIERTSGLEFLPWRVTSITNYVLEAQDLADKVGAEFLAIPVPTKHAVYNKYMPSWAQTDEFEKSEQRAIIKNLADQNIPLTDPYVVYQDYDLDETPLYYKRDTHWNSFGAYVVFYDAMSRLGLAENLPPPQALLIGYNEGTYFGVLDQFMGLSEAADSEAIPELDMTMLRAVEEQSVEDFEDHVSMNSYIVKFDDGSSGKPKLQIIGDSFTFGFFRPFLGAVFSEVRWSHHAHGAYDRNAVEAFQPDYLIFEFVDWEIPGWHLHETLKASN